ncbi:MULTISPECIES: CPBP family intramembrane glutamic endopeptidase [Paenibacillus]|uniref:CPBP family intramembrane glutamic endopeptidase n=1 Tax=Paenibacillus TaxID=44249 RepID=UPI000675F73F|nr:MULTISPECIES: type II CAAX endopeptidase family protein [Paenibacillus]
MNSSELEKSYRKYFWTGIIGAAIFLILQIIPSFAGGLSGEEASGKPVPKADAQQAAMAFARQLTGSEPLTAHTVHQSDRDITGYLSKEKLAKKFDEGPGKIVPTDTWQVSLSLPEGQMFVEVGMSSGRVIGWKQVFKPSAGESSDVLAPSAEQLDRLAAKQAAELGYGKLERVGESAGYKTVYAVQGGQIGQARLTIEAAPPSAAAAESGGKTVLAEFTPRYEVPKDYLAYTADQDRIASSLSLLGNLLPSGILFILAVIYSVLMRKYSSFRRGWAISLVFLGFYAVNNVNMLDGLRAMYGARPNAETVVQVQLVITMGLTFLLALSAYFSLVAGDGLWRAQGRRLWLTSRESRFGETAWSSMKLAYVLGFILLGLQTVILVGLSAFTGAWSTSDVTQSPYNLAAPLLMPLLAWCAAIQEEAVYRLFGIGLLMKWLKNPFAACLIPTIIWALGHVTYPIYPSTTRLIELTILGLLFGYIFLRFGFFTAVFAHAIMDSVLMSISLFLIGGAGNIVAGVVYIAAPAGVAWAMKWYGSRRSSSIPLAPG